MTSSPDGIKWSLRQSPATRMIHGVTGCGDTIVAAGDNSAILQTGFHGAARERCVQRDLS
jgi:hypothetical protein